MRVQRLGWRAITIFVWLGMRMRWDKIVYSKIRLLLAALLMICSAHTAPPLILFWWDEKIKTEHELQTVNNNVNVFVCTSYAILMRGMIFVPLLSSMPIHWKSRKSRATNSAVPFLQIKSSNVGSYICVAKHRFMSALEWIIVRTPAFSFSLSGFVFVAVLQVSPRLS